MAGVFVAFAVINLIALVAVLSATIVVKSGDDTSYVRVVTLRNGTLTPGGNNTEDYLAVASLAVDRSDRELCMDLSYDVAALPGIARVTLLGPSPAGLGADAGPEAIAVCGPDADTLCDIATASGTIYACTMTALSSNIKSLLRDLQQRPARFTLSVGTSAGPGGASGRVGA